MREQGTVVVNGRGVVVAVCMIVAVALSQGSVSASTSYGDLNNFDVFNDTGEDCHGFEIEIEDIHSTDITYTYDWNHYGRPTITEDNSDPLHPKVFIRYAARFNQSTGLYSAYTSIPSAPPAPTSGHACTNPSINIGCEHFGVGHYGAPSIIRYNWLIDDPMNHGNLVLGPAVNVATPNWTYYPPAQGQPAQVQAVIEAPPPPPAPVYEFGDAVWVKAIVTTSHNAEPLELQDLVSDDPDDPNDKNWAHGEPDEVEVEWQIMQTEFNNPDGANNDLAGGMEALPNGDEVVTRRYEFYEYVGPLDAETNEAICTKYPAIADPGDPFYKAECDPATASILGDYIGAQMAGFNLVAELGLIDSIQDGDIYEPYPSRTLVIGGNSPYTTQVTLGALPPGLDIDSDTGVLSGAPFVPGVFFFTITATDADAVQVTRAYTVAVGPGSPGEAVDLILDKDPNGVDLDFSWGASCGAHATDYAVYTGTIGSWYSHARTACSTGGLTSTVVTPAGPSEYYLVVPVSPSTEGSYGTAGDGSDLPPAADACFAIQVVEYCF